MPLAQEVNSLPVGPCECTEEWRGQARLAYNTMGVVCWRKHPTLADRQERMLTFITRCQEKLGLLSVFIIQAALDALKECGWISDETKRVVCWSDAGSHFRNARFLGAMAWTFPDRFRVSFVYNIGQEAHFKNPSDAWFSVLSRRRSAASLKAPITNIDELITAFKEHADLRLYPSVPEEYFDYFPPDKTKAANSVILRKECLPKNMKSSHSISFVLHDARRADLMGRGAHVKKVSGVIGRMHMLPHIRRVPACLTFVPELVDVPITYIDEDEVPHASTSSEIHCSTTIVQGWKTYYRVHRPEDMRAKEEALLKKLKSKQEWLGIVADRLPIHAQRAPAMARPEICEDARVKMAAAAREFLAEDKRARLARIV
jgi:hypothetical protein